MANRASSPASDITKDGVGTTASSCSHKFQFRRGNAENLGSAGIGNESVDLVVAG